MRHFIVTGNRNAAKMRVPSRFAVVCNGVERAIELAKEAYPDIVVLSIADQGAIDKVDQ